MEKIRVFLADWQILFREGIHFTLSGEDDFEVIGETASNEEALSFIQENPPSVAIFNADREKPTGIEITHRIKQNLPSVAVILLMDSYSEEQLFSAMKSGASACLSKDMDPDELLSTTRKVVQGDYPIRQSLLTPGIASLIVDEFEAFSALGEEVANLLARLLPDEAEILHRIAGGSLIEEITEALGITEEAVERYLAAILTKLVSNDRTREVIEAVQSTLTSGITNISEAGEQDRSLADYVTRDEFSSFKGALKERLESFLRDLT